MKVYEKPWMEALNFASDVVCDSNMTGGGGAGGETDGGSECDPTDPDCATFPFSVAR